jgi:hypothetical protein
MKSPKLSLTLDDSIACDWALIQALDALTKGRRQYKLRMWLSTGEAALARHATSVHRFTPSGQASKSRRLFINLKPDAAEDADVLNALAQVPGGARTQWLKEALIVGFEAQVVDIDLSRSPTAMTNLMDQRGALSSSPTPIARPIREPMTGTYAAPMPSPLSDGAVDPLHNAPESTALTGGVDPPRRKKLEGLQGLYE